MTASPALFKPLRLGALELPNRIMVSPMCQYSAIDGLPQAWHQAHLGALAMSGAGVLCLEATATEPAGRITHGCLGLYDDAQQAALRQLVDGLRSISRVPLMLQLAHAGRKASSRRPWEGGSLITPAEGGWQPVAPSAIAQKPGEAAPQALDAAGIADVIEGFAQAARRARAIGFDAIELHGAHGYLLHQFMSPLSNQRSDEYGGSLDNRLRLMLQVFAAVREAAGPDLPVGVRLSATDWAEGGWDLEQTLVAAQRLQDAGCDFLDISSGGISYQQKIAVGPGYQVPFAAAVKRLVDIPVVAVGLITTPQQAEAVVAEGSADMVALARAFLLDPRWPWRAAAELGGQVVPPPQLLRCLPQGHAPIFGEVRIGQR
jgi:2,4-dienoyl-CoA reductase-like NADH-dependent reductase (Old Yellow Enzyme family)